MKKRLVWVKHSVVARLRAHDELILAHALKLVALFHWFKVHHAVEADAVALGRQLFQALVCENTFFYVFLAGIHKKSRVFHNCAWSNILKKTKISEMEKQD
jgi:hypothetical protein